ncbi:MAG: Gfo/Idh/MocA family oxidoreductase [Clostridia bacterium]|nr:Gfo/Idh/MocA family oxidoreductase [Clostridia bacterium]
MRIGIIGSVGHWFYALNELPRHTVVGIAPGFAGEGMVAVINQLKTKGIEPPVLEDWRALLGEVDLIIVNTRFDLNAGITAEFLRRDVYVFAEKPLAITLEQLDILEAAQKDSKAFVTAMFGIRGEPWFVTVREAVKGLGEVRLLNGQKSYRMGNRPDYYRRMETFGGIIPWVAIHAIDWVHVLAGADFTAVRGLSNADFNNGHGEMDVTSLCQFEMEGGILASVSADFMRPMSSPTHDDDRVRVVCTEGVVEYMKGKVTVIDKDGERELPMLPAEDVFEQMLRRISGENVGVSPEDSFYITRVALMARDDAMK